jgi:hypothetical protein
MHGQENIMLLEVVYLCGYYYYHIIIKVFTIIYLKRTMFLGYVVLQLFCIYNLCYTRCYFGCALLN